MEPRAFCVGQAKSGTASLYGLLATRYRVAHEPERQELLAMILREAEGEVSGTQFADFLKSRQQRLTLEFDIGWPNQFIAAHLVKVFPEAKFIALFREPYGWLRSIIGHLVSRPIPPDVRAFLDWWFRSGQHPYAREDGPLRDHGLYSTRAFLGAWRRHIRTCTETLPTERRLILRTHEIDSSQGLLASFLGIPPRSLDASRGHLNRATEAVRADVMPNPAYVHEQIMLECGNEMDRYFPEFRSAPPS